MARQRSGPATAAAAAAGGKRKAASVEGAKRRRLDSGDAAGTGRDNRRYMRKKTALGKNADSDGDDDDDDADLSKYTGGGDGGIDEMELRAGMTDSDAESEGDEDEEAEEAAERETAAAKRLRLAKRYIETVKSDLAGEVGETDAADLDREIIASRLHSDALEAAGKMQKKIADAVVVPDENNVIFFSTRESTKKATTAVALPPTFDLSLLADGSMRSRKLHMFSSAKDGIIAQWDISNVFAGSPSTSNGLSSKTSSSAKTTATSAAELGSGVRVVRDNIKRIRIIRPRYAQNSGTGKRAPKNAKAHTGEVLCLTVSVDGKYLASGGADHRICLWDVNTAKSAKDANNNNSDNSKTGEEFLPVKVFQQHRDAITSLVFQRRTDNGVLYSASADRTIKLWNTDELGYIETLFGHQESIHDMDALTREQAVSVGGRDRSVRLWKISQEQQLVFKGGAATKGSMLKVQKARVREADTAATTSTNARQGDYFDDLDESAPGYEKSANGKASKRGRGADEDGEGDDDDDDKDETFADLLLAQSDEIGAEDAVRKQFENKTHYLEGSIDAVAMIDEDRYITGGDTGVISLWSIHKKKPVFVFHAAHGYENPVASAIAFAANNPGEPMPLQKVLGWNTRRPRAITAVAALPHSDMFMTGSWDGYVRLWKLAEDNKSFIQFGAVPANGIVNCISLCELKTPPLMRQAILKQKKSSSRSSGGSNSKDVQITLPAVACAVALGREPRLGRWNTTDIEDNVRNGMQLFVLETKL